MRFIVEVPDGTFTAKELESYIPILDVRVTQINSEGLVK